MLTSLIHQLRHFRPARLPVITLLSLLPLQSHAREQPPVPLQEGQAITNGQHYSLDSRILGEPHVYSVQLPSSYDAGKRYPVIYLLDGDSHRNKLLGIIDGLIDGLQPAMPEVIVVGLGNRKGEKFLDFMEQELLPRIGADYSTSGVNILMGHSFGGLLTLEAVRSQRRSFNAFVAIDPSLWFDYPEYYQRLQKETGKPGSGHAALFIVAADNPFTPGLGLSTLHRDLIREFSGTLEKRSLPDLVVHGQFYPDSDHSSVVLPAIEDSLRWLFDGYRITFGPDAPDAQAVIENYRRLNQRLGADIRPDRDSLQYLWAYIISRLPEQQRTNLFEELLKHYYPQLPAEPKGLMAH